MKGVGLVLSLLSGLGSMALAAQEQPPLRHEVSVSLKLIQVYVTDKAGKPVVDLSRDDFRLFDNGQRQTITDFERHMSPPTQAAVAAGKPPEPSMAELQAAPPPAALLNRKFFILIDCDANDLAGIAKARNAALRFIDHQAQPGDEISVLSYSSTTGIISHSSLTADHVQARTALSRIRDIPGRSMVSTGGADTGVIVVGTGTDGEMKILGTPKVRTSPFHIFIDRMTDLAKALRYIPGYKNVLFFSWGRPMPLNDGESVRRLDSMTKAFSTANAPFFTINTETPFPWKPKGSGGIDTLDFMARKTGGKAFYEVGAVHYFDEIAPQIQDLTRNYYVLGYPIQESWDGKYHKIKVEMVSGGYVIQAQSGYNNPKPFKDYSAFERELHLFDLALSDKPRMEPPLIFPMTAACFHPPEEESGRVLMAAKIPRPVMEAFAGREVELAALILDEQDRPVDRIRLKPKLASVAGQEPLFAADSAVPPGSYRLRIIIRDLETGNAAMAYARAEMPRADHARPLRIDAPLLAIQGGPLARIEGVPGKNSAWKSHYALDDRAFAPITGEVPSGISKLAIWIPYVQAAATPGSPALWASLVDTRNGASLAADLKIIQQDLRPHGGIVRGELTFEGIPAGSYRLYIYAKNEALDAPSYIQIPLTIISGSGNPGPARRPCP